MQTGRNKKNITSLLVRGKKMMLLTYCYYSWRRCKHDGQNQWYNTIQYNTI